MGPDVYPYPNFESATLVSHASMPVRASTAMICASFVVAKILSPKIAMFL
jgi:hypothetical protein